jgi:hypothetical protein
MRRDRRAVCCENQTNKLTHWFAYEQHNLECSGRHLLQSPASLYPRVYMNSYVQLTEKFSAFCERHKFILFFKRVCHFFLSWASTVHSTIPLTFFLYAVVLQPNAFVSFYHKMYVSISLYPLHATCPPPPTSISSASSGEQYIHEPFLIMPSSPSFSSSPSPQTFSFVFLLQYLPHWTFKAFIHFH